MDDRVTRIQVESMMNAREVCEYLGVSLPSIRRWTQSGALKSCRVGLRGQLRFRLEDVNRFVEESTQRTVGNTTVGRDTLDEQPRPLDIAGADCSSPITSGGHFAACQAP